MNDIINEDVIEKVVIKSVAIYKAMSVLPAPPFEDKFKKETIICQQNEIIQSQNLEKCLNAIEPSKEKETIDTTNEIKNDYEKKSWKDITNPKLRRKMRDKAYYESNKDKLKIVKKNYYGANKDKKKAYYEKNKDTIKAYKKTWCESNKDKIKVQKKAYREVNKDKKKAYDKDYNEANKDKRKAYNKDWREVNKDKIKEYMEAYHYNKLKTDIQYKLRHNLRARLRNAINRNQKVGSAVKDLGCTISELKSYLESKFSSGMTWDNWALDGWHIDHIKPLNSFDLTDRNQLLEACNYMNLQPLWATDNLIKSDKIL